LASASLSRAGNCPIFSDLRGAGTMLFTFLAALGACQTTAMRPELSRTKMSQRIATVGDLVSKISSPTESRTALQAASGIVDEILAETGNATEHMSDDDASLLKEVIKLVEDSIYGSMDSAHNAQTKALNDGKAAVDECSVDILARQAADGDLGQLQQHVTDKQTELDRLQGVVDEKTLANATEWNTFNNHMQMISNPPACPGLPARTMPALDVYFEKSEYSIWFAAQEAAYDAAREKYTIADSALTAAISAFHIQLAVRDTQYCDWKDELEAACAAFDVCFQTASDAFNALVPVVTSDMNQRVENLKAGDTLVQQIKFLLAESKTRETPTSDVSRYTIAFPLLGVKADCDQSVVDDAKWVPTPECGSSAGAFAGIYETWYKGGKRTYTTTIGCDFSVSNIHTKDSLHFDNVNTKCALARDASSTMTILNSHGRGKYECLRADGANLVGSHYTGPNQFWGSVEYKLIAAARCQPTKPTRPLQGSSAGRYEVWYQNAKRSNTMTINCNDAVSGNAGNEVIQFDGITSKCGFDRDAEATMFIPNLHGRGKFECLRKVGDKIVGNHYTGPNSFWGTIEYRPIAGTLHAC